MIKKINLVLCALLMSGCSSVSYYTQSVVGHTSLMLGRKPIAKVVTTADTVLKKKLLTAIEIRAFAVDELSLPDNKSYTSYVQLKNDPPIWNVVAADEFSLKAKQWCYLVIGCASYRGYYHREPAEKYGKKMREGGYDVFVYGVTAYSTLGWFADPLTSAMLRRGDAFLAELVFHELAHQQVYIRDNSRFNEAFASAVGEQGAIKWLRSTDRDELLSDYIKRLSVRDDFLVLVNKTKSELSELYATDMPNESKRQKKKIIFEKMKARYAKLKEDKWNNRGWYDRWFSKPLNNARLVSIATYRDLVPKFVTLFEGCAKDFERFYRQVEKMSANAEIDFAAACEK